MRKRQEFTRSTKPPTIQGEVSVRVHFDDMKDWQPNQVKAFMQGIAEVIAAAEEKRPEK